jgi:hypothetical protein
MDQSPSLEANIHLASQKIFHLLLNPNVHYRFHIIPIAQWYSSGLQAVLSVFETQQRLGNFLSTASSRPALGPTQPPIHWVPGSLSLGVKRPDREADNSHPSSAEVKNAWSYASSLPTRLRGVVLS